MTAARLRSSFLIALGVCAGALYAFHLAAAIFTERALAVDGANFLLNLLSREFAWPLFDDGKHIRLVVNLINQFPAALAIKAGVEDLRMLKLLFGAGFFLTPLALSLVCLALCRRARDYRLMVFVVASLITATLPSEQFKINPAFTAAALCWVPLAYATLRLKATRFDQALVVVVLIALFRSHEGMIVWGPILTGAAIWRLAQSETRRPTRDTWHIHAIAGGAVALTLFVFYWQITHPVASATQRFFTQAAVALPWEMWRNTGASRISLVVSAALIAILVTMAVRPLRQRLHRGWRSSVHWALWAAALASAALALHVAVRLIVEPWHVGAYIEYEYRTLIVFGSAAWMGLAVATHRLRFTLAPTERALIGFVLATGLGAASLWQLGNTKLWHETQRELRALIERSEETIIPASDVWRRFQELKAPWWREQHASGWHWPTYSIAIQDKRSIERFIMAFDEHFAVRSDLEAGGAVLHMKWTTLFPSGYFDFSQFVASYERSPEKQMIEMRQTVLAELTAIRAIVGTGTVVAMQNSDWFRAHAWAVERVMDAPTLARGRADWGPASGDFVLSPNAHPKSLTPEHQIAFLYRASDLAQLELDEFRSIAAEPPAALGPFNVYWVNDGRQLAWLRAPCDSADTAATFHLHLQPADVADLPQHRQRHGFDNLDFTFQRAGGRMVGGRCWAIVNMPDYPIVGVVTGQYDAEGVRWSVYFPAE